MDYGCLVFIFNLSWVLFFSVAAHVWYFQSYRTVAHTDPIIMLSYLIYSLRFLPSCLILQFRNVHLLEKVGLLHFLHLNTMWTLSYERNANLINIQRYNVFKYRNISEEVLQYTYPPILTMQFEKIFLHLLSLNLFIYLHLFI